MYLAVDLAAKFSAGIVMDDSREVHLQFDSWGRSPSELANLITETAQVFDVDVIVIEDLPYGISKQFMTKPVTRLQGRIQHALHGAGLLERTGFLAPATWQRAYEGVWKGGPKGAAAAATALGYAPPDLLEVHAQDIPAKGPERTKIRALLRKATTDYVDAYLIADWTATNLAGGLNFDIQGLQAA